MKIGSKKVSPHTRTHQIRIQEADLMLTRGRAVQESVKGALSELESVVRKLQVPGVAGFFVSA